MESKPDPVLDEFASTLVQARSSLGITQNELHKRTGISREAIKGYESGRNKPGAREIRLLCEALQISPNLLLFGTESPFEAKGYIHDFMLESGQFNVVKLIALFDLLTAKEKESFLFLIQSVILGRHKKEDITKKIQAMEAFTALGTAMMAGAQDVTSGKLPKEKLVDQVTGQWEEFVEKRMGPPPEKK